MHYTVLIHRADEGGYWAEVPALEGCFAQGETLDELLTEVRDAAASHIAALKADGQLIPGDDLVLMTTVIVDERSVA
jgi:predicted RNase H-like HicB family nuclease